MESMKTGIELIELERKRQISQEGWTKSHDDKHTRGELAKAASIYAMPKRQRTLLLESGFWPWGLKWYKPFFDNRIKELVKAGALIAVEIDRIQNK